MYLYIPITVCILNSFISEEKTVLDEGINWVQNLVSCPNPFQDLSFWSFFIFD